ncbi:MAG: phosphate acyltransferase PlsX [Akkermansiaceae bacterium]|nr:phosphate acyltransferase PlsX [Akkermansiaceae bacterium]
MKLALDAMGGDFAPATNVEGARLALERLANLEKIYLVGDEAALKRQCDACGLSGSHVEIIHAPEVVTMEESGLMAVRQKKRSSMSVAVDLVKEGVCDAVLSAGNTGAAVAASTVKLRLLPGVRRAGIATQLPNEYGVCNVMDTGANPDARASHLVGYAVMAAVLVQYMYGKAEPKVGLMSNGTEECKGNDFSKETLKLFRQLEGDGKLPFHFLGNVEGHDLFEKELDVVVTDGFTGNVLLKTCEATAKTFSKWLKREIMKSYVRRAGALLMQGAFRSLKKTLSADQTGGSPLLGVNGVSIIAHGRANSTAIFNAIRIAEGMHENSVNPRIVEALADMGNIPAEYDLPR